MKKHSPVDRLLACFRWAGLLFLVMLLWPFLAAISGGALAFPLLVLLYVAGMVFLGLVYPLTVFVLGMVLAGCLRLVRVVRGLLRPRGARGLTC